MRRWIEKLKIEAPIWGAVFVLLILVLLAISFDVQASDITWSPKVEGAAGPTGRTSVDDMNEIRTAVNSKQDKTTNLTWLLANCFDGDGSFICGSSAETETDPVYSAAQASLISDAGSGVVISATERAKLSGIEASATADQTGAEMVSAINTELGDAAWQEGGADAADGISVTPAGDIASTDAQAALEELDDEKMAIASYDSNADGTVDAADNGSGSCTAGSGDCFRSIVDNTVACSGTPTAGTEAECWYSGTKYCWDGDSWETSACPEASGGGATTEAELESDLVGVSDVFTDNDLLDEDNMASDSATKPASQQSIKAYVDNLGVATALAQLSAINAALTAYPALLSSDNSWDFGNTATGSSSVAKTFTITSVGTGTATLAASDAVTITGTNATQFDLGTVTCTTSLELDPTENCAVDVSHGPDADGTHNALLEIASDAADSPLEITLVGTGVTETSFIHEQKFLTGSLPSGWTEEENGGTADEFDYATSPAPLEGSYSYYSPDPISGANSIQFDLGQGYNSLYVAMQIRIVTLTDSDSNTFGFSDTTASGVAALEHQADGDICTGNFGGFGTRSSVIAGLDVGTTFYVMYSVTIGSGDASSSLWMTSGTSDWGTPVGRSDGTIANQLRYFWIYNLFSTDQAFIIDWIIIDDETIPISTFAG